jgi:hypothetical protein
MRKFILAAAAASLCVLAPSAAHAALLTGGFTIAGQGDVRVGLDFIDWGEFGNVFGPTNGDINFVSGTDSFAGLGGTTGTIADLNSAAQPVGTPFTLDNFLTFDAQPNWDLTLGFITPGAGTAAGCTAAPGAVCTPFVGSPFTIVNLVGGGSSVALAVRGTVSDGSGDPASNFVGTFTTQFSDMTADELIALIGSQGFVQSSHSAEFRATVVPEVIPEPATLLLLGTGLISAYGARRRQQRKQQE